MRRLLMTLAVLSFMFALTAVAWADMSIAITSPQNGDYINPCGDLVVKFDVKVTTETIKDIRFYVNGAVRGVVRKEPWEYVWKKQVRGAYVLQAMLRSAEGAEVWSEPIRIKVGPVSAGEKVQNGSFECNALAPWNLNAHSGEGAVATGTVINEPYFDDDNYLMVEIQNGGSVNWHVQLQQNIPTDSGHVYQISFLADADEKKPILITMQENQAPWAVQYGQDIEIDGANLYGPFDFEATRTDPTNYIRFNIGANTTTLYIDDIRVIDTSASGVKAKEYDWSGAVKTFELLDAYPNPFNMNTVIPFVLSQPAKVNLAVYNMSGQLVQTLAVGQYEAGRHQVAWNGLDAEQRVVPSGVYFYRLIVDGKRPFELSRKIVLVK